ncbi:hypothetical protein LL037_18690 [Clostridium estertheticum]|uniref:hypothetical protein n=1 Tax=Clostridium estertheticum TaxID=238834 RepID=UPI001C0DACE8|nr:hypothetical protein [Clostridium estertheticum]MBU3200310.1 hypothetical protein [Clostridium estertheticum]WAG64480.1 hypothetical protein LL037_18690 [Clostridium estertheticum]
MEVVKISNLTVHNYSTTIPNKEINECIKILPVEYQKLNSHVFIHVDKKSYLHFCLKNLRLSDLLTSMIEIVIEKSKCKFRLGVYKIKQDEIHLFEEKIHIFLLLVENQIVGTDGGEDVTPNIWNEYENMWAKYILMYNLIHELNHAIQSKRKKLNIKLEDLFKTWVHRKHEIDAVSKSEEIYEEYGDEFNKILKTQGIEVYHNRKNGLNIEYKFNIEVDDKAD